MQFTGDISLGNIAIIITLIGIAIRVGVQVGNVQAVAKAQAAIIEGHAQRLDRYESRLVDIVSDVSRLIGRIEATQQRLERNTGSRPGEGFHQQS
jgi:hypothetical protein